jgi:hypothetical protein
VSTVSLLSNVDWFCTRQLTLMATRNSDSQIKDQRFFNGGWDLEAQTPCAAQDGSRVLVQNNWLENTQASQPNSENCMGSAGAKHRFGIESTGTDQRWYAIGYQGRRYPLQGFAVSRATVVALIGRVAGHAMMI